MSARKSAAPRTIVPNTIQGVQGLLVARKWDKAAIVYAWTTPDSVGGRGLTGNRTNNRTLLGIREFAGLGISGLTTTDSVMAYRKNWVWAIEHGLAEMVGPGDEIDLDGLEEVDFPATTVTYAHPHEFDDQYQAEADDAGLTKDAVRRAAANKKALAAAIKADPAVAVAAREAIAERNRRSKPIVDPHGKQDSPVEQFGTLHMELRSAKRALTDALGIVIDIRGVTDTDEVRAAISGYVEQIRHVLNLIDEAAQGKSLDDELAALLIDEELQ